MNGGYFVEWDCGADLSADTIEAHLQFYDNSKKIHNRKIRID